MSNTEEFVREEKEYLNSLSHKPDEVQRRMEYHGDVYWFQLKSAVKEITLLHKEVERHKRLIEVLSERIAKDASTIERYKNTQEQFERVKDSVQDIDELEKAFYEIIIKGQDDG